jgi:cell division protein FtsB
LSGWEGGGFAETGLRRKAATLATILVLVALVVGALFGDRGILQLATERERLRALAHQLDDLHDENRGLAAEIEGLKTDPRSIERLAREEVGLSRPGEIVFVIRDQAASEAR